MNYYAFYDIPVSLTVDEALLKSRFYENSKRFHPDFFTLQDVEKQMEALEQSTLNNNAYKTLIHFDKRLHYLLEMKGVLAEEGKNSIPQAFLMEMMDVNEAVMELQFDFNQEQFEKQLSEIEQLKDDLLESISDIIPKKNAELQDVDLVLLKDYYLKSKYLIRLKENIQKLEE